MAPVITRRQFSSAISTLAAFLSLSTTVTAAPISYRVEGTIEPLRQPSTMTCWATAATIMHAWYQKASYDIPAAIKDVAAKYLEMFKANKGLPPDSKAAFLSAAGLHSEVPSNYTIPQWEQMLRKSGPLWVTTAEGAGFSIHARVLVGIAGDGTADGTQVELIDPADGLLHKGSLAVFISKFEKVARIDLGESGVLRPQVVHY